MTEHQIYLKQQIQVRRILMWVQIGIVSAVAILGAAWSIITASELQTQSNLIRGLGINPNLPGPILIGGGTLILAWAIARSLTIYIRTMNELMLLQTYLSIDENTRLTAEYLGRLTRRGPQ